MELSNSTILKLKLEVLKAKETIAPEYVRIYRLKEHGGLWFEI